MALGRRVDGDGGGRGKDGRKDRKRVRESEGEGERSDLSAQPIYHLDKMVAFVLFC